MLQGRKRGRPLKQSNRRSKKLNDPRPAWIGRWIQRTKIRKNGRKDIVRSFIIFIIFSTFKFLVLVFYLILNK